VLEEKYALLDSLYMTVGTLTTVDFDEVHTLSNRGRAGKQLFSSVRT
jgi:hypothetical protein